MSEGREFKCCMSSNWGFYKVIFFKVIISFKLLALNDIPRETRLSSTLSLANLMDVYSYSYIHTLVGSTTGTKFHLCTEKYQEQ